MKMNPRNVLVIIVLFASVLACFMPALPALAWTDRPAATTEDPGHAWTVVFDNPMDTSTINSQNIYVSTDQNGSSRVEGVAATAADSTHALVSPPPGGWSIGTTYYLIVTQNVLTGEGMPLEDAVRMQFTVQPPSSVITDSGIKVYLEDQPLAFTVPPQTIDGRVMVPMRPIFEAMGATLDWDSATQTATASKGATTVITRIGNSNAIVNGVVQTLDVPPTAINGSTLAPLRFVAEAFGYHVKWDGASQTAFIAVEPFTEEISAGSLNGSNNSFSSLSAGWLYLCQVAGSQEMYRMREDGTDYQPLINKSGNFTIAGDWLYYCNANNKLCRIKTDGSQQQLLIDEGIWSYAIGEGWIYYNNVADNERLYRVKVDGSEKQRLGSDSAYGIKLEGDWLYYVDFYHGGDLIRIRIDGSERQVLDNGICNSVNISGGWIYYRQHTANDYEQDHSYDPIFKMNLDGEYRQIVETDLTDNLNVAGNWIYYENYNDNHKLYRVGTDGSARQKICDDSPDSIDIAGEWIYYIIRCDYTNGNNVTLNTLYRIKTDGTGRQIL